MLGNMVATTPAQGGDGFADELYERVAKSTAGAITYSVDDFMTKKVIFRDCNGSNRTDVTPTATQIVDAIPNCVVGASFRVLFRNNTQSGSYTLTLDGGTGVTRWGDGVIAATKFGEFLAVVTNVSTPAVEVFTLDDD